MIQIKALQYNNLTVDVFCPLQKRSVLVAYINVFFPIFVLRVTNKLIMHNLQMDLKILHLYLKWLFTICKYS